MNRLATGTWEGSLEAAISGAADGFMTGAISGFVGGGLSSDVCFVAGTAILTAIGKVAIEKIEVVDSIWQPARNSQTAFVDEYMKMSKYKLDFGGKLINRIMSPGAKIFERML